MQLELETALAAALYEASQATAGNASTMALVRSLEARVADLDEGKLHALLEKLGEQA